MKIKNVNIHNWRSIKDVDIQFSDLMVFIGQNNHGKSNVLSGLLFFFGLIPCNDLDFNKGSDELFVEVKFSELDDHDKAQFAKYVTSSGTMTVRKSITLGSTFEYHGYTEIPNEDWLREDKVSDYTTRETVSGTPLASLIPSNGRITKDIIRQAQTEYIAANRDTLTFSYALESNNFLGLKSVAQGIFGEVFFIPAVKHASEELNVKGKSVFNQLLTNVINDMSITNPRYIEVKNQVKALTESLNKTISDGTANGDRPEQITQLESLLGAELESWNTTIEIEITSPDVDEVLRVGTNVWINDGVPTDVNRKGSGLQRSLIFALVKSWAQILSNKREADTEELEQRRASKSTYFIFEEPELYLHPQAQRELFHSLTSLTQSDNQVIMSTHSSAFIDLKEYKSICILYKDNINDGTKHHQCTGDIFSNSEDVSRFNMTYWINPDRGELFFAKKVILVEGQTDKNVIPYLANKIGCFRYDYTIIDCGTKNNIPLYMQLLHSFKLPYVAIYDVDNQSSKLQSAIDVANRDTQRILSLLDSTLGIAVPFVNDIEEELGMERADNRNKPYLAMEYVSSSEFVLSDELSQKISRIYS